MTTKWQSHLTRLALLGALASPSAMALTYAPDISDSDYQDWMVRLYIPSTSGTNSCGGGLIGGKYLLTAAHCVGAINYAAHPREYAWYKDNGVEATITIVNVANLSTRYDTSTPHEFTRNYTLTWVGEDQAEVYERYLPYYQTMLASVSNATVSDFATTSDDFWTWYNRDLVILTLDSPIPTHTGALLKPLFDENSLEHNVPFDSTFSIQGWGTTEDGYLSSVMRQITMQYDAPSSNHSTLFQYDYTDASVAGAVRCEDVEYNYCYMHDDDSFSVSKNEITGSHTLPGDSGTPATENGDFYGVLSTYNTYYLTSNYTFFDYYLPEIQRAINTLAYPTHPGREVDSGDTTAFTLSIPIQNFTADPISVSPIMISSDNASIIPLTIGGDCTNATLDSMQGCTVTLSMNESQQAITRTVSGTLALNDDNGTTLPVSLQVKAASTGYWGDDGTYYYDNETESSGGSMGLGLLLGLGALAVGRSSQRKQN